MSWDPVCTADHLCRNLRVKIDTATNYTFYLVVKADGNLQTSVAVQVVVTCGIEQLSLTKTLQSFAWPRLTAGPGVAPYKIDIVQDGVAGLFITSLTQCPIVEYNLFNDAEMKWPILDNTTIKLYNYQSPANSFIFVDGTQAFNRVVYLQAVSEGGKRIGLPLAVTVCGYERLTPRQPPLSLAYNYSATLTTNLGLDQAGLDSLFVSDWSQSSIFCDDKTLTMFSDSQLSQVWAMDPSSPTVELITLSSGEQRLAVHDTTKFTQKTFYLKRVTKGKVTAVAPLQIEVCGLETAWLRYPYNATVTVNLVLRSGDANFRHRFPRSVYLGNFTTSSQLCTPWQFEVFEEVGARYVKSPERVFVDKTNQDLVISTYGPMSKVWFLSPMTHGNRAYMPLKITVAPVNNS